jgi:hypothetical protein
LDEAARLFRDLVAAGASLSRIVTELAAVDGFTLTPFNLLRLANEAVGMSLTESRVLLEPFDERLAPLTSTTDVDRVGDQVLAPYRASA